MPNTSADSNRHCPQSESHLEGVSAPFIHSCDLYALKSFLTHAQIRMGLVEAYNEQYPLIEVRDLEPPFYSSLFEYKNLPGFSMVAFDRPLDYQSEPFQFDLLHDPRESSSPELVTKRNHSIFLSRLPRVYHLPLSDDLDLLDLTQLEYYPQVLRFLFHMDRGHVIACSPKGGYRLLGIYASFPSDLDREIKRFGFQIGKFKPKDNKLYERNRLFVYRYLMELYGFPITAERHTSAAMFARQLVERNENFLISVLGNSDRILTFISSRGKGRWPLVEKIALIQVDAEARRLIEVLDEEGYFIDRERRVIIFRATYAQHDYNPENIIEDRALSVVDQEALHPVTGEKLGNLNILKTSERRLIRLNDIVRGEHEGKIVYRGRETVYGTEDHQSRLKFLHAWLTKHRRTLLGYAPRTFKQVERTLESYLKNPEFMPEFKRYPALYQSVVDLVTTMRQEFQVIQLKKALRRRDGKASPSYRDRLVLLLEFLHRERELMTYQEEVFEKLLFVCDSVLESPYFKKRYGNPKKRTRTFYEQEILYLHEQLLLQRKRLEWRYFRSVHATSAV